MGHPSNGHFFDIGGMNPYIGGMVHTSEDGPYIGAPMFEHAFQRMATFICSQIKLILLCNLTVSSRYCSTPCSVYCLDHNFFLHSST